MKRVMRDSVGRTKTVKEGFSWTTLFFGAFVPLCRGDWKWFLIMLIAAMFTMGISSLVFCFVYNKIYIDELLGQGYKFE